MPTYSTPQPVMASVRIVVGDIRLSAADRGDTVVTVAPSDTARKEDVEAATQTRVEYANGSLRVLGSKGRGLGLTRRPGSVEVTIELPTGSHVDAGSGLGSILGAGRLGECRIRTGAGDIRLEDAAMIDLQTGIGAIVAGHVAGDAEITTGSGSIRVAAIGGRARVKNSNGDTRIGASHASLSVKASNGVIAIDHAHGDLRAATANGDVRVGRAEHGSADLSTALGSISVGIPTGTAALLDLHTSFGTVLNALDVTDRPGLNELTIDVRAQTSAGDITINRAEADAV